MRTAYASAGLLAALLLTHAPSLDRDDSDFQRYDRLARANPWNAKTLMTNGLISALELPPPPQKVGGNWEILKGEKVWVPKIWEHIEPGVCVHLMYVHAQSDATLHVLLMRQQAHDPPWGIMGRIEANGFFGDLMDIPSTSMARFVERGIVGSTVIVAPSAKSPEHALVETISKQIVSWLTNREVRTPSSPKRS